MKMLRIAGALGILAVIAGTPVRAQDYPARPVTIVVPTGPGGGMETVARLLAP
jgi:tripartite-type tricarboxylate transporter receptor subunit TctC